MKRPRRILLCLMSCGMRGGGIATVNRCVVRALADANRLREPLQARAIYFAGTDAALPAGYADGMRFSEEFCHSRRLRFVGKTLRAALAWRPDCIFVDHLHLSTVTYLLRPFTRNYVLFCHGIEFDGSLSNLRKAAFRAARMRLSNSRFTAERLMRKFPGAQVRPCELGLDDIHQAGTNVHLPVWRDAHGREQQPSDEAILIVGRINSLERYKGHDRLIEAFAAIGQQRPNAQLWIVGSGDDLERLKERARACPAGDRILFSGFVSSEELTAAYRDCAVFAMPSRGEGFGLVYLEAMQWGKPCVASNVDAGSEVVVDGQTGMHVDPDDVASLQNGLLRLLEDQELRARLGAAGRQRLLHHYQYEHFRDRLWAALPGF